MLITKAEFARRMNVTPSAVSVAVRAGRLTASPEGLIDLEQGTVQWALNRQRCHFAAPRLPIAAPDPDEVEFAEIAIWLAWHFGPPERLPIALESWASLLFPRGISLRDVVGLLSALRANLERLASPIPDDADEC